MKQNLGRRYINFYWAKIVRHYGGKKYLPYKLRHWNEPTVNPPIKYWGKDPRYISTCMMCHLPLVRHQKVTAHKWIRRRFR